MDKLITDVVRHFKQKYDLGIEMANETKQLHGPLAYLAYHLSN